MNDEQQRAIGLLDRPASFYLATDNEQEVREISAQLAPDPDQIGQGEVEPILAIGVASNIDIDRYQHIPGLLAKRYRGLRAWEVGFDQNLRFIVTDLRTGAVQALRSFAKDKRMAAPEPSRSGPEPDAINRNAVTYGIERFNLPNVYGEPWFSPRIAVAVVYYDWLSNSRIVDIHGQKQIRELPGPGNASAFLASTGSNPVTERLPGEGIEFAIPPRSSAGEAIMVQAALRLWRRGVVLIPEVDTRSPLLKASLLLIALDTDEPVQLDLVAPVTTRKINDDRMVEGSFSFDLRAALAEQELPGGLYQAYLVVGANIAGPHPITVE